MARKALELESLQAVRSHLQATGAMDDVVVQGVDLRPLKQELAGCSWRGAALLGCDLDEHTQRQAADAGALLFPPFEGLPFQPYRGALYSVDELYEVFDPELPESYQRCLDARVYRHWRDNGGAHAEHILETLARRLHDHAITDALEELLEGDGQPREVVAIMGGHGMSRQAPSYRQVAGIAQRLTREGLLMASGGGPGAMEATHLGAWMVEQDEQALDEALRLLGEAPTYKHAQWLAASFRVRARFPLSPDAAARHPSLGIPTWLYGHEPPNAFATHIAKYFANSVREDGLLAIAKHGVVYAPGSAGTIQEVFQDACQNHYLTAGVASPMIFLGVDYWTQQKPVYPLLKMLAQEHDYGKWVSITDDPDEVVERLLAYRQAAAST